ncbi:MAG: phycobilisome rod-core linker polypeptide [Cyanobacteria bacterium J06554_11]
MTDRINGGSPVVHLQQYHTVPTAVIKAADQRDRYLSYSEAKTLLAFLNTGLQRLEVAQVLAQHAYEIVAAGGKRIFVGGNPMNYLESPKDSVGLPGSEYFVAEDYLTPKNRIRQPIRGYITSSSSGTTSTGVTNPMDWFKGLFFSGKPSVPSQFRAINIPDYGSVRMKRSMRDLDWFLRYITYAIVAGDTSIISVNTKGLRGLIPEDVTLATTVALREMQWKSLSYFPTESAAAALVKQYFDVLIADYQIEKPSERARNGISKHDQGLSLPASYEDSASAKPRWVMKNSLPDSEKEAVIEAAYRQVFERDISQTYGREFFQLASQVKDGCGSMASFVRQLGKSRLYRQLYYEPYTISRAIELACRHFLGRGLSCMEEFQKYFELLAEQGFSALIDALVGSQEYADYFGVETVPYMRGLGFEAQACRNWGPQLDLFKYSAPMRKVPQFVTTFASYHQPLPNQHPYGTGNDPLEIQFGAIFPEETRAPKMQPAHFSEDSRRILISTQSQQDACSGIKHDQRSFAHQKTGSTPLEMATHYSSINSVQHSTEAIILAAYRQVFGCEVLDSQRHIRAETQLTGRLITVREFVRQLAKSRTFRRAYWENLYVTKATEVIHRRLLGRPTYGRRETKKYYDICGRRGFYALVDALIDSQEYLEAFGENTVPYERYITPRGLALRSPKGPNAGPNLRVSPPLVGDYMMRYQPPKHPISALGSRLENGNKNAGLVLSKQQSETSLESSSETSLQEVSQELSDENLASRADSEPAEVTA